MLFGNGIILLLIFVCLFRHGFSYEEFTTVLAIVSPMFAYYTSAVIHDFARDPFVQPDNQVYLTSRFVVLSFAMFLVYTFAVGGAVALRAWGAEVFDDFEIFKRTLLLIETIFAAWTARLVYTMFESVEEPARKTKVSDKLN